MRSIKFTFIMVLSLMAWEASAQQPSYKRMMHDLSYNFYEVVDSAMVYFKAHAKGKGSGWKEFERWRNENESKYYPTGDRYNIDHHQYSRYYRNAIQEVDGLRSKSEGNPWTDLGPYDAENITTHYNPGIGRVETFYIDTVDTDRIFLGSRSGGFWKTTDGGQTWKNTTDTLVATGVESIAVNPYNTDEVLIAVQHGGAEVSHGVYRSTDGGETWQESEFGPRNGSWGGLGKNDKIYEIAYHPLVPNRIYVCASDGLYISTDNLNSFKKYPYIWIFNIEFHPTDAGKVYAYQYTQASADRIRISSDTGKTFNGGYTFQYNNWASGFIAVTPAMPDYVYFATSNGLWRSTDAGMTFDSINNPNESCQGLAVSDLDTSHILYGYVDIQQSLDGGQSFDKVTRWAVRDDAYVHADVRAMECYKGVFYVGTDGYLCKSTDNGSTWTRLNDGTGIREFYAVGLSQSNHDVHMAGSQDNGTSIRNELGWVEWNGGDGMEALVQPLNDQIMLGSWQYGSRNYTNNGGLTRLAVGNPQRGSQNADWEAPLLLAPFNHLKVYHFGTWMYESEDFGKNWNLAGAPSIGKIKEAAIAENNPDIIAIAVQNVIELTLDGGQSWNSIKSNLPTGQAISDISFDPNDDSTLAVTYREYQANAPKIFISHDLGETWNNITYNLDSMPLRCVVFDHSNASNIYVGGEIGVYTMPMGGTQWTILNTELPNVTVKDLEVNYGSNTLKAATWGRGLWETKLVGRENYPAIMLTTINNAPDEVTPKEGTSQFVTSTLDYPQTLSAVYVMWGTNPLQLDQRIDMTSIGNSQYQSVASLPKLDEGSDIYFRVYAVGSQQDTSNTYRFHYRIHAFEYCTGIGSEGTNDGYITRVKVGQLENTSGQDFFGDYTSLVEELTRQSSYDIEIELNNAVSQDTVAAWIDFNLDASFSEDERIVFSSIDTNNIAKASFTVPADAVTNTKLHLRVRSMRGLFTPLPCDQYWGEVEDYGIMIRHGAGIQAYHVRPLSIYPNPNQGSFRIDLPLDCNHVEVTDIQGRTMFNSKTTNQSSMDVRLDLHSGVYIICAYAADARYVSRLVIE